MLRALAVVLLLSAPALAQPGSVFPSKDEKDMARVLQDQAMSAEVRAFLKSKMRTHNKDMRDLVMAVATLRFDEAKKWAQGIANAPRLDPSQSNKLEFPPAFFALQDSLKKQATSVSQACDAKNSDDLAISFNQMMNTCIGCHKAFMLPIREKIEASKAAAKDAGLGEAPKK